MQLQELTFFQPYCVYYGVFTASMVSFAAGVAVNWAATILPHLQSNDTSINPLPEPPTILESSWIVSIIMIGCITGPCIGGILTAKLGKKKTILLVGIPVCIGHLIIAFATTVWAFLIARFAFGLTLGCSFGLMASYVGDIAEDHNRGLLGSFPTLFMSIGGLYVYTVGPFTSVKLFSLLNLIPIVLVFMFFGLFVPDTPFDLLQYNSVEEARKSLAFYRGKTLIEIDTDFKILQDTLKSRDNIQTKKSTNAIEQLRSIYKSKPLFRGLKMVEAVFILQGLSGMGAVASYYQTIFDESSGSLDSIYSVMIIGVVTLFSTIITSQLVERLGRRVLLLVSFLLMGLSLFSLATYFLLKSRDHNIDSISWLPLVSLIVYTISYNAQGGIPWILLTDIFPSDVLDICTTITSITMFSLVFVISLVFPYLRELLGNYGAFYIFGCCMACAVVFTFLIVPETKGRSIEEVQGILAEKNCL